PDVDVVPLTFGDLSFRSIVRRATGPAGWVIGGLFLYPAVAVALVTLAASIGGELVGGLGCVAAVCFPILSVVAVVWYREPWLYSVGWSRESGTTVLFFLLLQAAILWIPVALFGLAVVQMCR